MEKAPATSTMITRQLTRMPSQQKKHRQENRNCPIQILPIKDPCPIPIPMPQAMVVLTACTVVPFPPAVQGECPMDTWTRQWGQGATHIIQECTLPTTTTTHTWTRPWNSGMVWGARPLTIPPDSFLLISGCRIIQAPPTLGECRLTTKCPLIRTSTSKHKVYMLRQ